MSDAPTNIRHLTCGHGRPFGARVFPRRFKRYMVCHCLLLEGERGIVLVDAGLSERELERPSRLGSFARGLGLTADPSLAATRQMQAMGLDPDAVTDVVLTHLDLDHAGGLLDFPAARVHVHTHELEAAARPRGVTERLRYRREQWQHANLQGHSPEACSDLDDAQTIVSVGGWNLALVPLFGHTRGHCGVLLQAGSQRVLHVGDTYYDASELEDDGSFLFRQFRRSVDQSSSSAHTARQTVRSWRERWPEMHVISSHDPSEFQAAVARTSTSSANGV